MLSVAVLFELGIALNDDYAVTTIAALDALGEIGYDGWIALGLVTAGVAVAALRDRTLPRWLGWISAPATVVFALLTFFPFVGLGSRADLASRRRRRPACTATASARRPLTRDRPPRPSAVRQRRVWCAKA